MKRIAALLAGAVLMLSGTAFAASSIVLSPVDDVSGQNIKIYTYTITAHTDGSVTPVATNPIDGWIIRTVTNPDDVAAPTNLYDLTLVDRDGVDVMGGTLMNRAEATTEHVLFPQPYVRGAVTITPTNNSVNGAVIVLRITVLR